MEVSGQLTPLPRFLPVKESFVHFVYDVGGLRASLDALEKSKIIFQM
jgi:hypothetical protein